MAHQSIAALDFESNRGVRVNWEQGRIVSIDAAEAPSGPGGRWIAPALCDIQVNGYAGVDYQCDTVTAEDLHRVAAKLLEAGCAQSFLTVTTAKWELLTGRIRRMRQARDRSPELQRAFPGWHIEGPFLSPEPGFCGAHDPDVMLDPTPEKIRELRELTGREPLLLTLAPERTGAIECIALAVSLGAKVSCGHTNASAETLAAAVRAGATMFTHLGNGCPQQLDRHDNILWRALNTPGLCAGLIPDMIHVSPQVFRIFDRLLAPGRFYYTTDCMSAAGSPPGRYKIGGIELEVGADKVVRQPGRTHFAGSALTPIEGIQRAAKMLGGDWRRVWRAFSLRPRELMDLPGALTAGGEATFCVLEQDGATLRMRVFVAGAEQCTVAIS